MDKLFLTGVEFSEDFRTYKKGETLAFKDQLTIITGNNGIGKSTLIGCMRHLFDGEKTRSKMSQLEGKLTNEKLDGVTCTYLDSMHDHLATLPYFIDDMQLQLSVMSMSSGQGIATMLSRQLGSIETDIVILDEPERGLSIPNQALTAAMIKQAVERHPDVQFFVISHSPEIWDIADDVLSLDFRNYVPVKLYKHMMELQKQDVLERFKELSKQQESPNT